MSTGMPGETLSHACLELSSRQLKALKIERLLNLQKKSQTLKLLEIGTGAGGIAHYFATHRELNCEVTAVDINDQRQVKNGFLFKKVLE
jgi:methylase of polypeptide subunit release factors